MLRASGPALNAHSSLTCDANCLFRVGYFGRICADRCSGGLWHRGSVVQPFMFVVEVCVVASGLCFGTPPFLWRQALPCSASESNHGFCSRMSPRLPRIGAVSRRPARLAGARLWRFAFGGVVGETPCWLISATQGNLFGQPKLSCTDA